MEEQVFEWVGRFSYPAVYLLLAVTGIGAPVSEDVVLLAGGMVVATGRAALPVMLLVAYVGVLTSDALLFHIGHRLGARAAGSPRLMRVLTPQRVAFVRRQFDRFGPYTVFIARFLPGLRAPTFLLAGSFHLKPRTFFLADGAASLLFAPLLVWLGFRFGAAVLPHVQRAGGIALVFAGAIVALGVIGGLVRRAMAGVARGNMPARSSK